MATRSRDAGSSVELRWSASILVATRKNDADFVAEGEDGLGLPLKVISRFDLESRVVVSLEESFLGQSDNLEQVATNRQQSDSDHVLTESTSWRGVECGGD